MPLTDNHQNIRSKCLVREFSLADHEFINDINHGYRGAVLKKNLLWLLPFYTAMATYIYYEKVRRAMRTAVASYLLRLGLSHLWGHKFKHNFSDCLDETCTCGRDIESANHFLLQCFVFLKGTLMEIWRSRYMVCFHMKTIPWKFCILNPKNSRVICPWSW